MVGKKRKRITRTSLEAAKVEARKLANQIASGRNSEHFLTLAETEDYRIAKNRLNPFGVSLLTALEEWIAARSNRPLVVGKNVPEIIEEFLVPKQVEGACGFHLEDRKYRLQTFAAVFPGRVDRISTHEIEVWLNGMEVSRRSRNNYRNAVLQHFRYARGKRYLPRNEATVVEDVAASVTSCGTIEIYTPSELRFLLKNAPPKLLPFFANGALAGLRSQEIMQLDWSDSVSANCSFAASHA